MTAQPTVRADPRGQTEDPRLGGAYAIAVVVDDFIDRIPTRGRDPDRGTTHLTATRRDPAGAAPGAPSRDVPSRRAREGQRAAIAGTRLTLSPLRIEPVATATA